MWKSTKDSVEKIELVELEEAEFEIREKSIENNILTYFVTENSYEMEKIQKLSAELLLTS